MGWPFDIDFSELSHCIQNFRHDIHHVIIYAEELKRTPVWKTFRKHCPDIYRFSRCNEIQAGNLPKARPG
jgi:RTC4-like domain